MVCFEDDEMIKKILPTIFLPLIYFLVVSRHYEDCSYFLKVTDKGGLELYVNAEKVGHAIKPELRPVNDTGSGNDPNATAVGAWIEKPTLNPVNIFDRKVFLVIQKKSFDEARGSGLEFQKI